MTIAALADHEDVLARALAHEAVVVEEDGLLVAGLVGLDLGQDHPGAWAKIGIAIGGLVLGWFCYSIASNILTYLHTLPEERR